MENPEYLKQFVKESSCFWQSFHCRNVQLTIEECPPGQDVSKRLTQDFVSSIVLWGSAGSITLKARFDLDTATTWASRSLGLDTIKLGTSLAIDFFREFSNLQAGFLCRMLDSCGLNFNMGLPSITLLGAEGAPPLPASGEAESISWRISDGYRAVTCTAELRLTDVDAFRQLQPSLEKALKAEMIRLLDGDDGDIEYFGT